MGLDSRSLAPDSRRPPSQQGISPKGPRITGDRENEATGTELAGTPPQSGGAHRACVSGPFPLPCSIWSASGQATSLLLDPHSYKVLWDTWPGASAVIWASVSFSLRPERGSQGEARPLGRRHPSQTPAKGRQLPQEARKIPLLLLFFFFLPFEIKGSDPSHGAGGPGRGRGSRTGVDKDQPSCWLQTWRPRG